MKGGKGGSTVETPLSNTEPSKHAVKEAFARACSDWDSVWSKRARVITRGDS